jgi:hypothetical protein
MKKISFVAIACFTVIIASAQTVATSFSKKKKVEVTNWDARGVLFLGSYWNMAKPQLTKMFSGSLVDSIVNYSSADTYPTGLNQFLSSENEPDLRIKNRLRVYLVGQFDNNTNGTFYGVEYILWLPKDENKNFKPGIVWEHDIFILIKKDAVKAKQ